MQTDGKIYNIVDLLPSSVQAPTQLSYTEFRLIFSLSKSFSRIILLVKGYCLVAAVLLKDEELVKVVDVIMFDILEKVKDLLLKYIYKLSKDQIFSGITKYTYSVRWVQNAKKFWYEL